jgi:purine-binding chemotaxis protein CheW
VTGRRHAPIDWAALKERLARAAEPADARPSARAAVLAARAEALARRTPAAPPAAEVEVVVFTLGGERYALPSAHVREVAAAPALARLPGAPAFVLGLANLRGEVVDVLDLRPFLGAAAAPTSAASRLLVLGGDRPELAVWADAVEALQRVDAGALRPAPDAPARTRPEYVRGLDPSGVALLDGDALLQDPRLRVDDAEPLPSPEVP